MPLETALAIAMLGAFIWAIRFLVPKALEEHDAMAFTCADRGDRVARVAADWRWSGRSSTRRMTP
jgi:hypothetical protein